MDVKTGSGLILILILIDTVKSMPHLPTVNAQHTRPVKTVTTIQRIRLLFSEKKSLQIVHLMMRCDFEPDEKLERTSTTKRFICFARNINSWKKREKT